MGKVAFQESVAPWRDRCDNIPIQAPEPLMDYLSQLPVVLIPGGESVFVYDAHGPQLRLDLCRQDPLSPNTAHYHTAFSQEHLRLEGYPPSGYRLKTPPDWDFVRQCLGISAPDTE